jgi:dTDP-4-amino-4,6-dideoxygalactose transaminase
MYEVGQQEIDAVAQVIRSRRLFRYMEGSQCARFEQRYAKFLGVKHAHLTSSGTAALTAGLTGLGIGPGMEVLVPAHTYMATAVAVLAVGAIPVIVDVDESITIDPDALEEAIGPRTRAVIPVHMWGVACDMDRILRIARRHGLLVMEDACQGVGGAYEGKMLGSMGHTGAFSFNYFKNMTCGEGGAIVTNDARVASVARCTVDCCGFYWTGREGDVTPFVASGSRASEIEGAVLNAQLERIGSIISRLRRQKKRILRQTADTGLKPAVSHSLDWECGSMLMYLLPTAEQAQRFAAGMKCGIAGRTGRHTCTDWDPILQHHGARHPQMDPFRLPANRRCRKRYGPQVWKKSLDILNRTVQIRMDPQRSDAEIRGIVQAIRQAAEEVLEPPAGSDGTGRRTGVRRRRQVTAMR